MSEKKPTARREVKIAVAYPPIAHLLPPEVGQRKAANRARGRAIFMAIIALGVAILAAAGANLVAFQRGLTLESARATTLSLTQQQGEYSEVRAANQALQSSKTARVFIASTEVSIQALTLAMGSKLTEGMVISNYNFDTATPMLGYGDSVSPLEPERMAEFTIELDAPSMEAIDAWVRAVPDEFGLADVTLVSAEQEEGVFSAQVVVFVNWEALLHLPQTQQMRRMAHDLDTNVDAHRRRRGDSDFDRRLRRGSRSRTRHRIKR